MPVLGEGQTVALLLAAAGFALLLLALALEGRRRPGTSETRTRSALVGALLITAGLALMLVRRLDPTALSRVLAGVTAAVVAAAVAERSPRWPAASGRAHLLHGHLVEVVPADRLAHGHPKELS